MLHVVQRAVHLPKQMYGRQYLAGCRHVLAHAKKVEARVRCYVQCVTTGLQDPGARKLFPFRTATRLERENGRTCLRSCEFGIPEAAWVLVMNV